MFKNIATWALLAAALVQGSPLNIDAEVEIRDLELEALLKHDLTPLELEARNINLGVRDVELDDRDVELDDRDVELDDRDVELDDRDVEARASRQLNGLANFDNKIASTIPLKELGIYGGLYWQGFGIVRKNSTLTGVRPFSAPNIAVYGAITKLTNDNTATITTQYSNSIAANFSLSQFYYGCSTTTLTSTLALPAQCRVAAAGYSRTGKLLAYQLFPAYSPGLSLSANLQLGTFSSAFKGLDHVVFASTYSVGQLLGATIFDDVKYVLTTTS